MDRVSIETTEQVSELDILRAKVAYLEKCQLESKSVQANLQNKEELYRSICENIPQLLWHISASGEATYFNRSWYDYTGQDFEHSRSLFSSLIHPDDEKQALDKWTHSFQNKLAFNAEFRIRRFDGVYRWFLIKAVPVCEPSGKLSHWVGTCIDINDAKELDALKDLFVSIVGHELRNPLTVINGYTHSLLKLDSGDTEEVVETPALDRQKRYLQIIQRQTVRMDNLITQLQELPRIQYQKLELDFTKNVDLVDLTHKVVEQFSHTIPNHSFEFKSDVPILYGSFDVIRIEQILTNLISNGVKYSPENTKIAISLELDKVCNEALITVVDTGCGIDPAFQSRIFDRFYRERTRKGLNVEGLGLGLFITKELVERHNGRIWLQSTPGEGTTFYVALPLNS